MVVKGSRNRAATLRGVGVVFKIKSCSDCRMRRAADGPSDLSRSDQIARKDRNMNNFLNRLRQPSTLLGLASLLVTSYTTKTLDVAVVQAVLASLGLIVING